MNGAYEVAFRSPASIAGRGLALARTIGLRQSFPSFPAARRFVEAHMAEARQAGACRAVVTLDGDAYAEYFNAVWLRCDGD